MKSIYVTFEDAEIKELEELKDKYKLNWRQLILTLVEDKKEVKLK